MPTALPGLRLSPGLLWPPGLLEWPAAHPAHSEREALAQQLIIWACGRETGAISL